MLRENLEPAAKDLHPRRTADRPFLAAHVDDLVGGDRPHGTDRLAPALIRFAAAHDETFRSPDVDVLLVARDDPRLDTGKLPQSAECLARQFLPVVDKSPPEVRFEWPSRVDPRAVANTRAIFFDGFDNHNYMVHSEGWFKKRRYFTEGQIFRAQASPGSTLNSLYGARPASLPQRHCAQFDDDVQRCPALDKRIWADGNAFPPN